MPTTKKTTTRKTSKTNGHQNGTVTTEHIELLKQQYRKLKTNKTRDEFLEQLTLEESFFLSVSMMNPERMKERLTMAGLL